MTYDYSVTLRGGPNCPVKWMKHSIRSLIGPNSRDGGKILMGIPFYGYDNHQAIVGQTMLEQLFEYKPEIKWESTYKEHYYEYNYIYYIIKYRYVNGKDKHLVYYPTLKMLYDRLELANTLGCGIGIWEIGQGLDYFYDIF